MLIKKNNKYYTDIVKDIIIRDRENLRKSKYCDPQS